MACLGLAACPAQDESGDFPARAEGVTLHKFGLREYAFEIKLALFRFYGNALAASWNVTEITRPLLQIGMSIHCANLNEGKTAQMFCFFFFFFPPW